MAYIELVKNFERIRDYMREFYVYGFRTRSEMNEKSARSYDEERRHIEDYLGDYMGFRTVASGKQVFLSFDSRSVRHNPLYEAWKTKSFTNADIYLHFTLLDILSLSETPLTQLEIMNEMADYEDFFENPMTLDESTIRKKLNEYVELGLIRKEKNGRKVSYSIRPELDLLVWRDAINFYSEVECCGVIGNFMLDLLPGEDVFTYKHHYITQTMDSEICLKLLTAIHEKRFVRIINVSGRDKTERELKLTPLKIYVSTQNGRQYVITWDDERRRISPYRVDYIRSVTEMEIDPDFSSKAERLAEESRHVWGVSYGTESLTHVEFTVHFEDDEPFIYDRLVREKRCGTVELLDKNTAKFRADLYNANEMYPWIRTFICRITELHISDEEVERKFFEDLDEMYRIYLT